MMEWEWLVWGGVSILLVNVLTWVFLFGRKRGTMENKIKSLEDRFKNQSILPECNSIFTEIKEKLAEVGGKVSALLVISKENQKNNEKKHTSRQRKVKSD